MIIELSLTALSPLQEGLYCKASCIRNLCIFGGFSEFFLQRSLPVREGCGWGRAPPWGEAPLTPCLWVLSCWRMPFADVELLTACKSHGQMGSQARQAAAVPVCPLDGKVFLRNHLRLQTDQSSSEWGSQDPPRPRRPRFSGQGCISPFSLSSAG